MSEQHEPRRVQQTMPEDGGGWHQINAGPHLHIMFHPNRQLLGREADGVERPSIVVAVAGKREQALRFDPFSMGSHYHIRPGLAGQIPLRSCRGAKPARCGSRLLSKAFAVPRDSLHRPKKTMWRRVWTTPTCPGPPNRSRNSTSHTRARQRSSLGLTASSGALSRSRRKGRRHKASQAVGRQGAPGVAQACPRDSSAAALHREP